MLAMPLAKRAFTSSTRAASQAIRTTPSSLDKNLARSMAPPTKPSRSKPSLASNAVDKLNEHQSSAQVSSGSGLRQLKAGKFAAPHHLSPAELLIDARGPHRAKIPLLGPSRRQVKYTDPFLALKLDPLQECQNAGLFNNYLTNLGRIQGRNKTGLCWKSQRRLGKAVRRARCMGLLPYWNKLPI